MLHLQSASVREFSGDADLDPIRVRLNSAQPDIYARDYRPRLYALDHAVESIRVAHERGLFTS